MGEVLEMDKVSEKQWGSCQDSQSALGKLTYYDLTLYFRTEFRFKIKKLLEIWTNRIATSLIASAPSAIAIMAP